jgi:ribosomal protein S13
LKNYLVSFPLKQNIKDNINKKIVKKIYQGLRHKLGLSVHGQRTHSNCKTFRHFFKKSLNLLNTPKSNKKQVKKNMLKKKEEKQKKKELDKKKSKKKK